MNRSWSEVAFFIRPLCFYVEGRALIFFCPKKFVKWKQVQITNTNDSTKTSGLVQVWIHPDNDFVPIMEPPSFCWTSQNTQHSMRMQSLNYKPLPGTIEVSFNIWLANYCVRISYYFTREKCYDICFSNQLKPFRSQKVQNKVETKYYSIEIICSGVVRGGRADGALSSSLGLKCPWDWSVLGTKVSLELKYHWD